MKHRKSTTVGDKFLKQFFKDKVSIKFNWDGLQNQRALRSTYILGQIMPGLICGDHFSEASYKKELKSQL
jgi:hypothetical protein